MSDSPLQAAGNLVPEEQDLAKALIEIADKYGKFNEDQTGIWADYHEAEDNPYAEMGVKCGNCVLYRGGQECAIIAFKVDSEGYCRFAVLPDGSVDPSKAPAGTKPFEQHDHATALSAGASKPAPKKDRIHGSKVNKPGSASGKSKLPVRFSAQTEAVLRDKVAAHNKDAKPGHHATLNQLRRVYRRGAGAYSSSHRSGITRDQWALARVNAYLHLLKHGKPANPNYVQDNDVLPAGHSRSSKGVHASASMPETLEELDELFIELREEHEYLSPEHALLACAEVSGLGYEVIPALRAAWLRAAQDDESAFERVKDLALNLYQSRDADLLPRNRKAN